MSFGTQTGIRSDAGAPDGSCGGWGIQPPEKSSDDEEMKKRRNDGLTSRRQKRAADGAALVNLGFFLSRQFRPVFLTATITAGCTRRSRDQISRNTDSVSEICGAAVRWRLRELVHSQLWRRLFKLTANQMSPSQETM